jgi:hypothetical protein
VIRNRLATRPRRRPSAAAFAVLCLVALVGAAVPALAAAKPKHRKAHPGKATVLTPKREARTAGKTLAVRVRVSTPKSFHAEVSSVDVTRRFHRHGRIFEATLRRGRDYGLGENLLAVRVGKGRQLPTMVPFVSLSRAKGLLKVTKLAAHGRTPLRFRISAAAPLAGLKVTVDGRRYRVGSIEGRRGWTIAVGATDGVHYGANQVVVAAEREGSKHYDREVVHFGVGRGAPLAGAGADLVTRSGKAVTLRGGSTMAGSKRGSLIYRWEIVKKPAGSHARIAHGTKVNARLLPDLPGAYKVRLTVARVSKATAAAENAPKATASSAEEEATKPTCLEAALTPLTPAGGGGNAPGKASATTPNYEPNGNGPLVPLSPLESPPCVTPIGELTTPSLPLEAAKSMSVDESEITALPTESPMGWPIETITSSGAVTVGPQTFSKKPGWVRMLVLGNQSLIPVKPFGSWPEGEKVFSLGEGEALKNAVESTTGKQTVILTGMGVPQQTPPESAVQGLTKAIGVLGGPTEEGLVSEAIASGNWSVIGTKEQPGRTITNLHGLGEQPIEGQPPTLPGSINGYMQNVQGFIYTYVSAESIPIDTKAEGSSNTVSVFEVGGEKVTSGSIANGSLALHIAVFNLENASGKPSAVANYTDVIDNPNYATNEPGVQAAAEQLEQWRIAGSDNLIVMQTFGEEAVGENTAPWASRHWVNDALIPPNRRGLLEWDKQPYLKAKNESELEAKQAERWNPGYPTVAGQVGELTGEVGHDLVSILGGGNPKVEVSRLTMVAENDPETIESNYVDGYAAPSPGRVNGLLVRNARGGLQLESASAMPLKTTGISPAANAGGEALQSTNSFREIALSAKQTPWPLSTGAENEKALEYIAKKLWAREDFKTPREAYVAKPNSEWGALEAELHNQVKWEAGNGFELGTFKNVREQIERELNDLRKVQKAMDVWKQLFGEAKISAFVNSESIGAALVEQVEKEAKQKPKDEAEVNPEEVIEEALYIVGDLSGFPEDTEFLKFPEIISMVASGMGLAESVTPEAPEEAEGPNANLIRAKATEIGKFMFEHFEKTSKSLAHFESLFAADWGKLQLASEFAVGPWSYGTKEETTLGQSMAVTTEQALYEGLLPMAYEQWVISPYYTKYMPSGPQAPGNNYKCIHFHTLLNTPTVYPFKGEPAGGLSTSVYRPFDEPGSSASPAQPFTVPFTIRALKSYADNMEVIKSEYSESEDLIEIHHGGANPPGSLIDKLFTPVKLGEEEDAHFPVNLGMNKTAFYAGYGEGPNDWKRAICAQG